MAEDCEQGAGVDATPADEPQLMILTGSALAAQFTAPGGPRIYRYEVPVDDQWHDVMLTGPIVHVAARFPDVVEVWAVSYDEGVAPQAAPLKVFGTGQPLDCPAGRLIHLGTTLIGGLVWHLMGRVPLSADGWDQRVLTVMRGGGQ